MECWQRFRIWQNLATVVAKYEAEDFLIALEVIGRGGKGMAVTGTWFEFFTAFALFLASHRLPLMPRVKTVLQSWLGARGFTIAYSFLSALLLIWLIAAAANAPFVPLWEQAVWQRWVANLAMPAALGLVVFGVGIANPLSFGGHKDGFDPDHPGVAGVVRHPLLWGLALWSGVHMLVNGDLAHVILFGIFAGFSLLGMVAIDRRFQRQMGRAEWQALARSTSAWPFAAVFQRRWRPTSWPSLPRMFLAVIVWLCVLLFHTPFIGVSPLP